PKTYRAWYENYLKEKSVPFWPNAAWRDVIFSSVIIIVIILLSIFLGAPALTGAPDPSVVHTSPTPDWYMVPFFALFALMPHKIESVAMMVGPLLTIFLLFSIPFISNRGERSPLKRPWAMFGVLCVFVFIISLLISGMKAPWSPDFKTNPLPLSAIKEPHPDSTIVAGVNLFYAKGCQYCHKINNYGGAAGPNLTIVGNRLSPQELTIRIVNGSTNMPSYGGILSKDELNKLVVFLASQK
ncbi:MAG: c-type cytochrome, partial [Bacteroidota bacterium]|nr:c-type cytochrome [Bacteroidota bacterium]